MSLPKSIKSTISFSFFSEKARRDDRDAEWLIDFSLLRAEGNTTSCSGRNSGGNLYYSTSQDPLTALRKALLIKTFT